MNESRPGPKCARCGTTLAVDAPDGLCPHCLVALNFVTETDIPGEVGPAGTPVAKPPAPPAPTPQDLAPLFPQFEILECLGRGGMGAVYKARQPKLDRCIALKILLRRQEEGSADRAFAERFAREARALARLNHPSIVAVYDYGEAGGYPFLVMEFVGGLTLRQLLQRGKLAPDEALAIVPKICEALQFAHQKGIVHRDIKPENILLDTAGQVKIADFGIAKIIAPGAPDHFLTGAKDVVGTPHYMAPEQVEQPAKVDHRADIYSLGVVFYEMLTGELPLGKFQPPSNKVQIDVRLDEVVLRALAKEPERRYQQASQVKTAVETITTSRGKGSLAAPAAPSSAPTTAAGPQFGNLVGSFFGLTFTSPRALKLANLSALGFLCCLGFAPVPIPGWQAVFSFSGFFGLLGVAFIIEAAARRRVNKPIGGASVDAVGAGESAGHPRQAAVGSGDAEALTEEAPRQHRFAFARIPLVVVSDGQPATKWPAVWLSGALMGLGIAGGLMLVFAVVAPNQPAGRTLWPVLSAVLFVPLWLFLEIRAARRAMNQLPDSLHERSPQSAPPFSRTAIVGAVWGLLFAVSWVWNYTPPGWMVTHALRDALGNWAVGLVQGPLALVAFAAPVAVTVLGWRVVNGIRRSQGRLRGLGLALADAVVFPLLLVDYWLVWLCERVGAAISGASHPGATGAVIVGAILALVLDGILIAWLWRRIQEPLPSLPATPGSASATADPERSWRKLIRKAVPRAALIAVVHLCLLETILQAAVHRPESTGELWYMALFSSSLAAMAWAAWPLRRTRSPIVAVTSGTLVLFAVLCGIDSLYSLRLRPNLGLYEEDDWVSQHPGFQWGWRQGTANALWNKPMAQPFAPVVETTIPLGDDHPAALLDLDTGRQMSRDGFDADDEQTLAWARSERLDLALVWKTKRIVVLGLGLGAGWVPHFVPREELTSQAVVSFWQLDRKPAKECSDLQVHTNLVGTLVFRTRERGVGLLELAGLSDNPRGVKIRYKLVPQTPAPAAASTNRLSAIARTTQAVVLQQVEAKLSSMKLRLRLTEDQDRAVRALLEKKLGLAGELSVSMTAGSLSKEALAKADQSIRDLDQRLKNALTPDQWAEYEKAQVEERRTQAQLAANVEVMELQPVLHLSQTQRDQVLGILTRLHEQQLAESYEGLKIPVDWEQQLAEIKNALEPMLTAEQVKGLEKWLDLQRETIKATLPKLATSKPTPDTGPGELLNATSPVPLIEMKGVPLADAIKALATQMHLNYLLDPKITAPPEGTKGRALSQSLVSARWEHITAQQALTDLLRTYDLELIRDMQTGIARIVIKGDATANQNKP